MLLLDTSSKYYCGSDEQNWNKNPSPVQIYCYRFVCLSTNTHHQRA